MFRICIDVYQLYEGNDYDKMYEVLLTLKSKKLKKRIYLEYIKMCWKFLILNKTIIVEQQ